MDFNQTPGAFQPMVPEDGIDYNLKAKLNSWHDQIAILKEAEKTCLLLKANEKALAGSLYLKAEGSVAERQSTADSSTEMRTFRSELAIRENDYLNERRKLEVTIKEYEACYMSFKINHEAIKRGVS